MPETYPKAPLGHYYICAQCGWVIDPYSMRKGDVKHFNVDADSHHQAVVGELVDARAELRRLREKAKERHPSYSVRDRIEQNRLEQIREGM